MNNKGTTALNDSPTEELIPSANNHIIEENPNADVSKDENQGDTT